MMIEKLQWDSDFFGLRIGRVEISSEEEGDFLVSQIAEVKKEYDLVYVFASHGCELYTANARLVDKKVVYSLTDATRSELCKDVVLWDVDKGVTDELLHLTLVSGEYSRFKLDDGFPQGSYERLYSRWIEQSVNHKMASDVFCYMIDKAPIGLVTLNIKNGIGSIGLVAIHEDYQHRGIGSAMMSHVIRYSVEKQVDKLNVATQLDNIPACRLYKKNGFEVNSVTDIWHWWL